MNTKLALITVLAALSLHAQAGITHPKFESVTCAGDEGKLSFYVPEGSFTHGSLPDLKNYNDVVVHLENSNLIRRLLEANVIRKTEYDPAPFLESIGIDPASVSDRITVILDRSQRARYLSGGKYDYQAVPLLLHEGSIIGEAFEDQPHSAYHQDRLMITANNRTHGRVSIDFDIVSPEIVRCVETTMVKNPYFTESLHAEFQSPEFVEACTKTEKVKPSQTTRVISTTIAIHQCSVK